MSTRAERIKALPKAAAERILIMDGAMGTEIQNHKIWLLTQGGKSNVCIGK